MSYSAHIKTKRIIEPQLLFQKLEEYGEQLKIVSNIFPSLRFGTPKYALRGIEVNKEEEGYEVKAFTFSSMADYQLFPKVVLAMQILTEGDVYSDDEQKSITEPKKRFGLKWRRSQEEESWKFICDTIKSNKEPIYLQGINRLFKIESASFEKYKIDLNNPTEGEQYKFLMYNLMSLQWNQSHGQKKAKTHFSPAPGTKTGHMEVAVITLKNNEVESFDYIPNTEEVEFRNEDNQEWTQVKFKDLRYILPPALFYLNDDNQFVRKREITKDDFIEMLTAAKQYDVFEAFFNSFPKPSIIWRIKRKIYWFFVLHNRRIKEKWHNRKKISFRPLINWLSYSLINRFRKPLPLPANNDERNLRTESYFDKYPLYKRNESDTIYWVDVYDKKGEFVFTFDKIHVFNLYKDYPQSLTEEQKIIFDKENPYWADFFKDRQ